MQVCSVDEVDTPGHQSGDSDLSLGSDLGESFTAPPLPPRTPAPQARPPQLMVGNILGN